MQWCTCSKLVHLGCSLLSRFKALGSSHFWSCSCCALAFPGGPNTVRSSLGFSSLYTFIVQSGSSGLLCQYCACASPSSTNFLYFFRSLRFSSFSTLPNPSFFWLFLLCLMLHLSPLTLSGFFNGMLDVFKPEVLNYSTSFCFILWVLSVFRKESSLYSSSSFGISGYSALRSNCTHSRSGILSPDYLHASVGVIFVRQDIYFSKLSTFFLTCTESGQIFHSFRPL